MKSTSHGQSGKLIAIVAAPLASGALWWGMSGDAGATLPADQHTPETCFVQDKTESSALDMKLIVHRPGWVAPVVAADSGS